MAVCRENQDRFGRRSIHLTGYDSGRKRKGESRCVQGGFLVSEPRVKLKSMVALAVCLLVAIPMSAKHGNKTSKPAPSAHKREQL